MTEQEKINICLNCKRKSCPKGVCPDVHDTAGGKTTISSLRERAEGIKDKKEQRRFFLDHGVCPKCKRRKVTPGYCSCLSCRNKINENSRIRYERKNKDGKDGKNK